MQRRLPAQPRRGMAIVAAIATASAVSSCMIVALLVLVLSSPSHAFGVPAIAGRAASALSGSSVGRSRVAVVEPRFPALTTAGRASMAPSITSTTTQLFAKKAAKKQRESKGFGKPVESSSASPTEAEPASSTSTARSTSTSSAGTTNTPATSYTPLQSVSGDWSSSSGSPASPVRDEEDLLTPEERAARILRDKYGMKTLGEQQIDVKQQQAMKEQRKKFAEWKKKLDSGEDQEFDIMSVLPAPVLLGIDAFLKVGVTIAGAAFVLSGIGITLEAWSKTTGNSIDPTLDAFIVEKVEPNFTAGLLILLSFSVSLGLFAAAQLGSAGATYKEDD